MTKAVTELIPGETHRVAPTGFARFEVRVLVPPRNFSRDEFVVRRRDPSSDTARRKLPPGGRHAS
jgi:hypothetical protein